MDRRRESPPPAFRAALATPAAARLPRAPDLLDLYGVFSEAGLDLATAAAVVYAAHGHGALPPDATIASARTAAPRVLRTLAEYDDAAP